MAQGIELEGMAEMGFAGGGSEINEGFLASVDITFVMAGATDNGLTFGAEIDLEDANDMGATTERVDDNTDFIVFIGGAFGNLTLGDTDGAFDFAMQEVGIVGGSLNDAETEHAGFNGNSIFDGFGDRQGQVLRYDNTFGDFTFAASVETSEREDNNVALQFGGRYEAELAGVALGIGVGYANVDNGAGNNSTGTGVSVDAAFAGGFSAAVNYSSYGRVFTNGAPRDAHYGIGLGYEFGPFAVGVNYGVNVLGDGLEDAEGYGIAATYDLGGGAEMQFGYGSSSLPGAPDTDEYSFGLSMAF